MSMPAGSPTFDSIAISAAESVDGTVTRFPVASQPTLPAVHATVAGRMGVAVSNACGAVVTIVSRPVQPAAGPPGLPSEQAGSPR